MIYCPQCGTPNKPNSKFCKNCAALLQPSTDIRCPICGTMNPQDAEACKSCGARLKTSAAGASSSDQTTLAHSPENIAPFNPPELTQETDELASKSSSSATRAAFSQSNSQRLRRLGKTPSAETTPPSAPPIETPSADIAEIASAPTAETAPTSDDWLKQLDANPPIQSAAPAPTAETAPTSDDWLKQLDANPPITASNAPPAKPQLSEMKLTGDDYDYSDIGGEVTAEMQAQLEAEAGSAQSVEDEVALAMRLLGLSPTGEPLAQAAPIETLEPVASIAPETITTEAVASIAEIETPAQAAPIETIEPVANIAPETLTTEAVAPIAEIETSAASEPPIVVTSAAETITTEAVASVAEIETPTASEPPIVVTSAAETITTEPVASITEIETPVLSEPPTVVTSNAPPAKPQLSEMKLTGDDYDYSDIGGEVTAEMQAQLEAEAGNAQSVEDEVALAMRLLGLSPTGEPLAQAAPIETLEPVANIAVETITTEAVASIAEIETPTASEPPIVVTSAAETITTEAVASIAEIETPTASEPPIVVTSAPETLTTEAVASIAEIETPTASEPPIVVTSAPETLTTEAVAPIAEIETSAASEPPIVVTSAAETLTTETVAQTGASEPENAEWLANLAASSSAAVAAKITPDERAETAESETAHLPEQEPSAQTPIAETSKALPHAIADTSHLPEWLRDMAPSDESDDTVASAMEEMPGWIQDLAPGESAVGATGVLSQLPDLDESERQDLPDWLREPLAPVEPLASDKTAEPSQAEAQFEFDKEPTESDVAPQPSVELPLWMRDDAVAGRDPFELVETSGPLAGVSGVLPLALALTEPHTLSTTPPPRADSGRIFQTLLAEPLAAATSAPTTAQTGRKFSSKHAIYLVIALAALLALFLPAGGDELGLLGKNMVSSPSAVFYDQLNALPATSVVLMAFEYTPGQVPELDPAARAILEILALRQTKVVASSSNPNGAILAQRLLEETQRAHPDFMFANLGYIPGNEAGLKKLALGWLPSDYRTADGAAWSQSPLANQVRGMDDFAQIILMLGDSNGLNGWMTQVQPVIKTPIIAATTVALEPQARIYVNSKQLAASLRGLTGAAELELWSGNSGRAVKTVNALSFVGLALAGIIIIANLMWLLKRGKK